MSKCGKKWLFTAAVLILVGAAVFVGSLAVIGFDLTKLSTQKAETNTYAFNEEIARISVNAESAAVAFVPSDNGLCKVECVEEERAKHSVKMQNGTLTISAVNSRKWHDRFGINLWSPKVTVYLPKEAYTSLSVETATGDIEISDKFRFETIAVTGTTSNISCYADASKNIELHTTTGNIALGPAQPKTAVLSATTGRIAVKGIACRKLTAETHTGHIELKDVIAEESMIVQNTTGGVRFDGCDAADLTIKTSTGDVIGTLLSGKTFVADTITGEIRVPQAAGGGKCEITTSTGNIDIAIE